MQLKCGFCKEKLLSIVEMMIHFNSKLIITITIVILTTKNNFTYIKDNNNNCSFRTAVRVVTKNSVLTLDRKIFRLAPCFKQ